MGLIESEAEAIAWVHQMAKTPTPGDHEVAEPHPYCLGDDPCCCVQLIAASETARADERIKAAGRVERVEGGYSVPLGAPPGMVVDRMRQEFLAAIREGGA